MVEFWVKIFDEDDFEVGVNDIPFDEQKPEEWKERAYQVLEDALKNKEYIELKISRYPLGREYDNKYWKTISFEYVKKGKWRMDTIYGSDGYAVWPDVGMTGVVEDPDVIYVDESDVEALFREFIEDPQNFDIDWGLLRGGADVRVHNLWGIQEFREANGDDWDFILEIWDDEHVTHYLCKNVELDYEMREAILDFVIEKMDWDVETAGRDLDDEEMEEIQENIKKVKEALRNAKTIREFLEWWEENYS